MSSEKGEAEVAALARDAGVSHEAARHALICNLLYARIFRAREQFLREHGETLEVLAAWNEALGRVLGAGK